MRPKAAAGSKRCGDPLETATTIGPRRQMQQRPARAVDADHALARCLRNRDRNTWRLRSAIAWPRVGGRLQDATTWEGVGAGHDVPYVDFARRLCRRAGPESREPAGQA